MRQTTNMYSAVKILHFHLACIKNTHISTSLPTSHTSNTWLRISDRPLITSRTSGKKKSGERYSCNFLLVISLSLDDGSWQNWDRGARAKRPNTSESSLCCTISLFSDSVPRLFKIHARNGVWFGFQDSAGLKGLKEKRERRGGRKEMLTAFDGLWQPVTAVRHPQFWIKLVLLYLRFPANVSLCASFILLCFSNNCLLFKCITVFVNATFNRNFNWNSLHVNITMLTCLKCTSMPLLTVFSIIDKKKDPFHFAAETVRHTKNINSEDLLGPGQWAILDFLLSVR